MFTEELPYRQWRDIYDRAMERTEEYALSELTVKMGGLEIYVNSNQYQGTVRHSEDGAY